MAAANVKDVAALAGVSLGTVSNAINRPDRVSPTTLGRVNSAIEKLGYVRNDAARQLRAGHSHSIGLIVLDATNPFFTDVSAGAEDRAAEFGLSVLVANSAGSSNRELAHLALFEEQRVRGVLLTPVGESISGLDRLRARGIATVLVGQPAVDSALSSVSVDDAAGGALAVEHLLSLGRTRIAFVGGPSGVRQVADRLAGAHRAVGASPDARLDEISTRGTTVLEGRRVGEQIARRERSARPDAIFAANDLLAVGLLQGLSIIGGLRVPDDIALIGYDDIAFASSTVVALSSIRQPSARIGRTAIDLLLAASAAHPESPRQIVYSPELIVRASTASVPSHPPTAPQLRESGDS